VRCAAGSFGGLVRIAKGTSLPCRRSHSGAHRRRRQLSGTWSHPFSVDWESPKQADGGLAFQEKRASPFSSLFASGKDRRAFSKRTTGFVMLYHAGPLTLEVGGFSSFESATSIVEASRKLS
jgi:hypothetical protein